MNQHKDLLYRQKYATYQLNNRTFSTQNTKMSARSLAISYIMQVRIRIVKKKKKTYYQLLRKIWWLPHPRPPTRALYAKLQLEKLQFLSLLTTILNALICWKFERFRGLCPLGPRQGLCPCTTPGALRRPLDPIRMRRIACFRHTHTIGLLAIIYNSFFSSFWSVCKTFFRRKKYTNFGSLSPLARYHFSQVSCVLVSIINKTISRVLRTQSWTLLYRQTVIYQQCIYWDLRRIVCFQRRYIFKNRLARFARTQSCIHFLQFPTRRHSIRPYIMNINEHIKWTNTRIYCTDKNMLLTNLTIARFQRKIRKFRLARSQSVTYVFRYVL